ncbi:class I lanthipeptide [Bernardetia sp.]|uniref:class I lanthipeptide n=1 Tax=Bernardetia sp. TaxID=1937974 RepID=UPI0025C43C52|nr:class I lanthipeptide [Bernardetia sp.]
MKNKLKLKKEKIVVLTDEQQASVNGGAELALTGSRLIVCGSKKKCSASCKGLVCIPL